MMLYLRRTIRDSKPVENIYPVRSGQTETPDLLQRDPVEQVSQARQIESTTGTERAIMPEPSPQPQLDSPLETLRDTPHALTESRTEPERLPTQINNETHTDLTEEAFKRGGSLPGESPFGIDDQPIFPVQSRSVDPPDPLDLQYESANPSPISDESRLESDQAVKHEFNLPEAEPETSLGEHSAMSPLVSEDPSETSELQEISIFQIDEAHARDSGEVESSMLELQPERERLFGQARPYPQHSLSSPMTTDSSDDKDPDADSDELNRNTTRGQLNTLDEKREHAEGLHSAAGQRVGLLSASSISKQYSEQAFVPDSPEVSENHESHKPVSFNLPEFSEPDIRTNFQTAQPLWSSSERKTQVERIEIPTVHIGQIDITIESTQPALKDQTSRSKQSETNWASRLYLRGV